MLQTLALSSMLSSTGVVASLSYQPASSGCLHQHSLRDSVAECRWGSTGGKWRDLGRAS